MQSIRFKLVFLAIICLFAGCSTVQQSGTGKRIGFTEYGKASYYADKYHKQKTASGEIYRHELMTAAHKKLPFGSIVRLRMLKMEKVSWSESMTGAHL